MLFSKQKVFCNCCGKELFTQLPSGLMGGMTGYKVCSPSCIREMRWREVLSIMNKEYYPDPNPYKEDE